MSHWQTPSHNGLLPPEALDRGRHPGGQRESQRPPRKHRLRRLMLRLRRRRATSET
jgi:hypothetical protein